MLLFIGLVFNLKADALGLALLIVNLEIMSAGFSGQWQTNNSNVAVVIPGDQDLAVTVTCRCGVGVSRQGNHGNATGHRGAVEGQCVAGDGEQDKIEKNDQT